MPPFAHLAALDDAALLRALRWLFVPGQPDPELTALTAALRGRVLEVPVPGGAVRVDLGDWTSILLVRLGAWEPHLLGLARALVRPGDVVVDAGAHIGTWTVFLASLVGPTGWVVAVEPHGESARRAAAAAAAAGFGDRVSVVEAALADREGRAPLHAFAAGPRFAGADSMLRSLVLAEGYAPAGPADEVRVTTLDALNLPGPATFLKLDTEGLELAVLRGGRLLLARSPAASLLVELHAEELQALGATPADVFAELAAQGFAVLDLRPEGAELLAVPLAPRAAPTTHHVLARRDPAPLRVPLGAG